MTWVTFDKWVRFHNSVDLPCLILVDSLFMVSRLRFFQGLRLSRRSTREESLGTCHDEKIITTHCHNPESFCMGFNFVGIFVYKDRLEEDGRTESVLSDSENTDFCQRTDTFLSVQLWQVWVLKFTQTTRKETIRHFARVFQGKTKFHKTSFNDIEL